MLIVLLMGFANTGTASAVTASSATLRRNELEFMRVNVLSIGSSQRNERTWEQSRVDTQAGERVDFPERHLLFLD
jgi:hypothetical protein